jgi:mono/diheme cytochrome c family protein
MIGKTLVWRCGLILLALFHSPAFSAEPDEGKRAYLQYCSSCHGAGGKGDGPVSRDLKVKVPDLTTMARKKRGVYPLDDVMATIDGRRAVRAHGDREMPVWGETFRSEAEGKKYPELSTLLKAKLIAEHVGTLQRR